MVQLSTAGGTGMKILSELDKSPFRDFKRAHAAAANSLLARKLKDIKQPLQKIIDLKVSLEDEFPLSTSDLNTGEPGLGKNRDIVAASSKSYVTYQILGRLF